MLMLIVARCERRYLIGDVQPVSEPFPYPPSPYWIATGAEARRLGFRHVGNFATKKGTSNVKGLQSLWLSEDQLVFAAVISGSLSFKKCLLRSKLADGTLLESSDSPGLRDVSGSVDRAVLVNAGLEDLLRFHRHRATGAAAPLVQFPEDAGLAQFESLDWHVGVRLVELGKARWADGEQATIRFTLKGAWEQSVTGLFREIRKLKPQQDRFTLPRAGKT